MKSKSQYYRDEAKIDCYDDLPDGAWWAACCEALGDDDDVVAHMEARAFYEPKKYTLE